MAAQKASTERQSKGGAEGPSRLSGLSTNETLFLTASGWEPVDICSGAAVFGMRRDTVNTWGSAQDQRASEALASAMATAVQRLEARCRESAAHGVIGTEIITEIEPRYIAINLVGTGIRPVDTSREPDRSFTSNLSPREFVLLGEAGWKPVGLASGGRFVRAYRRNPIQTRGKRFRTWSWSTRQRRSLEPDPRRWRSSKSALAISEVEASFSFP